MKNRYFLFILIICLFGLNVPKAKSSVPDKEHRIFALSQIWKEMQYNYAFPEILKDVNIDSLYLAYLPKIEKADSEYEYFKTLSAFIANFKDAHTRIYCSQRPDDMPPVKMQNWGDRIFIKEVAEYLESDLPVGSEVLKVSGIPVMKYLNDSVYEYISAANVRWKRDKAITEMLYGQPLSKVSLLVRTPSNKLIETELVRNYGSGGFQEKLVGVEEQKPIIIKIIDNNIGYIELPSFIGQNLNAVNTVFNDHLAQLKKCKGLIIDIRSNRGGSDAVWENIAKHLLVSEKFKLPGQWLSRINVATYKNWGSFSPQMKEYAEGTSMKEIQHGEYINDINDSLKLNQPLVVLSGQYTASAAEDFLLLLKGLHRAIIVGEPSVGCIGEPTFTPLISKGYELMYCSKKYVTSEGLEYNSTGILPDVYVSRSYEEHLKGNDNVLNKGIEELQKIIN